MWLCEKAPQCRGISKSASESMPAKADTAYDAVLQLLYSYSLVPGQHLSDQELACKLNIGRTPVREALIRLAAEGKILSAPQRGYFTRPLVEAALFDSYAVAREILALALTCRRPQCSFTGNSCDDLSLDELAIRAEMIFTIIAEGSSNCEICKIIAKFTFCSHPIRMKIIASELHTGFRESLSRLTNAMTQFGKAAPLVESALMNHLDVEQRAIAGVVQEVKQRTAHRISSRSGTF
ncbi:regulatory protein, gntR family [Rhizobium tibeticum]|uniref:Putative HTH-type transcriptional regulator YdfH n=1 Tax=Rhizobium tibeticum TaxID=501024 RepID=A0A1H8VT99_9HYPH|nr:GntR family transcriptional regulator [Rhizobium tibeticum]SEI19646.1 putative HTH-type transcriptional regulator YdfH [Rhizobium tibeticum]SEP18649.1 regulatory protein, gntR family [Rhizobium tibeticum]